MRLIYTAIFILKLTMAFPLLALTSLSMDVNAESAVLINGVTGKILFEKEAHTKRSPASITKIATAIFTLLVASDKLDELVTADYDSVAWVSVAEKKRSNYSIPAYWLEPGYSNISLKKGEVLSLRDLFYGMMLVSGDDASNLIAKHVGGTVPQFMAGLNAYLQKIGCKNTLFSNPHGLYHPDHYTTAYDMAILTKEALKNPLFREVIKTTRYTRPKTNLQEATTWIQTNKLLLRGKYYYPHAIGGKTGYIQAAQNTIVAAAEKDGRLLIAALLKTKERREMFIDTAKLFEIAFNEPKVERVLFKEGPQTFTYVSPVAATPVTTVLENDVVVSYYPSEEPTLSCKLIWDEIKFPLKAGERVAELLITSTEGDYTHRVELKAGADVDTSWLYYVTHLFDSWSPVRLLAAAALIITITVGILARRRF